MKEKNKHQRKGRTVQKNRFLSILKKSPHFPNGNTRRLRRKFVGESFVGAHISFKLVVGQPTHLKNSSSSMFLHVKSAKTLWNHSLATCLVFLPWHRTLHCCVSATRTRCGACHPVLRRGVRLRFARAKCIELSISGSDCWFFSSWWFQPVWKIIVKLGHFPK